MDEFDFLWLLFLAGLAAGWWGWSGRRQKGKRTQEEERTLRIQDEMRRFSTKEPARLTSEERAKELAKIREQIERDVERRKQKKEL